MFFIASKRAHWKIFIANLFVIASVGAAAPSMAQNKLVSSHTFPDLPIKEFQNHHLKGSVKGSVANDRKVLLGSVGSDLWHGATDSRDEFWMITDRGPNGQIVVEGRNRRTFWVPEFNPMILRVKTEGNTIRILETLPIVGRSGEPVTGLPNLRGIDETPYDYAAKEVLPFNVNGLDTEGIVRTDAGDFWIADEYGPSLVHVDRSGKVVKRYVPEGVKLEGADYPIAQALPAIYAKRKINRGFEGLALSADEKTLYLVLQSPLLNPEKNIGDASRNTRLLIFDIRSEKVTAEYAYRFEASKDFDPGPKNTPDEMKLSGVVVLNPTTLLILERTDVVAKLYTVDLSRATNLLGGKWDDVKTAPALEALADPASAEVRVLPKSLVVDLSNIEGVPEKIEGIAVLDQHAIAISNDNDFDSEEGQYDDAGNNVGKGKKSKILIISLDKPLPLPTAAVSAR
jgi:hypothetical protein